MKTYLRFVDPIVALAVLVLCLWAASFDEWRFKPSAIFGGGIPTYFVAKGLFCSSALLLIGWILSLMSDKNGK
jgi:hypothetical protein